MESYVVLVESSLVVFSSDDGDYLAGDGVGGEGDDGVATRGYGDGAGGAYDVGDVCSRGGTADGSCGDGVGQGTRDGGAREGVGRLGCRGRGDMAIDGVREGCGVGGRCSQGGKGGVAILDVNSWIVVECGERVVKEVGDGCVLWGAESDADFFGGCCCDGEVLGLAGVVGFTRSSISIVVGGEVVSARLDDPHEGVGLADAGEGDLASGYGFALCGGAVEGEDVTRDVREVAGGARLQIKEEVVATESEHNTSLCLHLWVGTEIRISRAADQEEEEKRPSPHPPSEGGSGYHGKQT